VRADGHTPSHRRLPPEAAAILRSPVLVVLVAILVLLACAALCAVPAWGRAARQDAARVGGSPRMDDAYVLRGPTVRAPGRPRRRASRVRRRALLSGALLRTAGALDWARRRRGAR
jgi:hypothetical protein